ncbi:MAG: tRNA lysidine(34) synthetase TilS, partial [Deltaproteobacteria bacterium HGW-Deltaproteobacteria-9]
DQRGVAGAQADGALGAAHQHAVARGGLLGAVQAAGPVGPQFGGSGLRSLGGQQERAAAEPLGLRAIVGGELALEVVQQHAFGGQGHVERGLAGGDGATGQLQAPFLLAAGPHPGAPGGQFRGAGVDLQGAGRVEEQGDTVVIALSGGADSCALLWCLVRLSDEYGLKLVAAHFNHGLRQEQSDEDEVFCRGLAQKFSVDFLTQKMLDPSIPRGVSPEDYFRRERYCFLDKVATDCKANKIALGHHMQDQAETVLLNVLRGSGLDGLKGFLPMRDRKYIRPLIGVTRQDIIATLKKAGIDFREDSTNSSHVYLRNRLRGELIPMLQKKYNPRIEQNLARMAEIVRRDDDWISGHVNSILTSTRIQYQQNQASFSAEYFKSLHEALGFRLVRALLEGLSPEGRGFHRPIFKRSSIWL